MADSKELEDMLNSYCSKYATPECAICVDEFDNGDSIVTIPGCRHYFHQACIKDWWHTSLSNKLEPSCPMCKSPACSAAVNDDAAAPSRSPDELRSALLRVSDEVYVPSSLSPSPPPPTKEDGKSPPPTADALLPSYPATVVDNCVAMLRDMLRVNTFRTNIAQGEVRRVRSSLKAQATPNPYMQNSLAAMMKRHRRYRKTCRSITAVLGAINASLNIEQ